MPIADRYAGFVVDIDGVVLLGDTPIAGAGEAISALQARGLPVVFVTNNSTRTVGGWLRALNRAGVEVGLHDVLSSALAAASLVAPDRTPCAVIGEEGLISALTDAGIPIVAPSEADAVVVGWDRSVTWERLRDAAHAIGRGARFIATNTDPVYPSPDGVVPGNGATVAFLRTATGVEPEVAGKPETPLLLLAESRVGATGRAVLMIGDQIATDVVGAVRMGWDSALVATGVAATDGPEPTYRVESVTDLLADD